MKSELCVIPTSDCISVLIREFTPSLTQSCRFEIIFKALTGKRTGKAFKSYIKGLLSSVLLPYDFLCLCFSRSLVSLRL